MRRSVLVLVIAIVVACGGQRTDAESTDAGSTEAGAADAGAVTPWIVPADGPCVTGPGVTTLASLRATGLAVDDRFVYLVASDGFFRIPRAGGDVTKLAPSIDGVGLTIDAIRAYFLGRQGGQPGTDAGAPFAVFAVPLAGGAAPRLVTDQSSFSLATDGRGLYWTSWPLDGLRLDSLAPIQFTRIDLTATVLAIGRDGVYVGASGSDRDGGTDGRILRASTDGGATTTLVTGLCFVSALAVDETSIYFVDLDRARSFNQGRLLRASLDGSAVAKLADINGTFGIALDAHDVYFGTAFELVRVPKGGGPMTVLASGMEGPDNVAVRGGNVRRRGPVQRADGRVP